MKKSTFLTYFLTGLLLFLHQTTKAEGDASAVVRVKKVPDFELNGKGTAPSWSLTDWIGIPSRNQGSDKYLTRAKVLYSDKGVYFLFDCEDKKLTCTLKEDYLNLYEEDVVEVFLWTSEDFPVYFEYELSPLNYELPIMVPNYHGQFFGWLPWQYKDEKKTRHVTSIKGGNPESGASVSGWMAEIFIPFPLLAPLPNVPAVSGTKWRANLYRIDYDSRKGASYSWQKTQKNFHDYNSFGTLLFE